MTTLIKAPKKLIEVALPLDDINRAAAKEKSIRHGHPSTLHLWWARRPLAAARAVLFAQLVNDPGGERGYFAGKTKEQAKLERERLFDIIRDLVKWENIDNEDVLSRAREAIKKSWIETCEMNKGRPGFDPENPPAFHDPFAGGGAIPLEAQRLGLTSYASDLNPVAVLINKAMIEIPPRFAGRAPVGPTPPGVSLGRTTPWHAAQGIAEDVRRYATWMREEAFSRIGHLYPKVDLPAAHGGGKGTVIAWLWVRTVKSPNPAFADVAVPITSTFVLSSKSGKEFYADPIIEGKHYRFEIKAGKAPDGALAGTKLSRGAFKCLLSDTPIKYEYINDEANAGRMGARLMAMVVEGPAGRFYVAPTSEMESVASEAEPNWKPETACRGTFASNAQGRIYGFRVFADYFTRRQLVALDTFADLVDEARTKVKADAISAGMVDDGVGLDSGGAGATAYAEAISVYLAFALSKAADRNSSLCFWEHPMDRLRGTFGRQGIAMTWDFAETNPFAGAGGDILGTAVSLCEALDKLSPVQVGFVEQRDAQKQNISAQKVVSTDPPYYDNVGYADLSDYFYVWLRRALRPVFADLFATMAVPKVEELVATPYRHGGKDAAERFFLEGMTEAMHRLSEQAHPAFPTTIYYAFKASDTTDVGTGNTGWETFLEAVLRAGFAINGTWPMRTELTVALKKRVNALASSIVLVCRKREEGAATISRREFLRELKEELGDAVLAMIGGAEGISPVAPVDLAQAVIGPGMAVFSKYAAVLEADGSVMTVHTALTLINRVLTEGSDDFDADTQFCLGWFDQLGWAAGEFGQADVLARAKGTSVDGAREAGVASATAGSVRLLRPAEYPVDWSPDDDSRTPVWGALHQLIRALQMNGEADAGRLLARMPHLSEAIRSLGYRLFTLCERKNWTEDAFGYNALITSWLGIEAASHEAGPIGSQSSLNI